MLIGEVARRSGISARMLRHYESLGLVRPSSRTGSGYREYSGADIRRIFHIESLRSLGLSLKETARALDDPAFAPAALVGDLIDRTRERMAAEERLLTRLSRIDAAGPADWEDVLQAVALLQALASKSAGARQRAALAATGETAPVPADALAEAALNEADPNVAGALRWALARSDDDVPPLLAQGLDSPLPAVRERAVRTLAELPGDRATPHLRDALTHPDEAVRGCAALALGARGHTEAVPALVGMIVAGRNDTDAADALSVLCDAPGTADEITDALVTHLTADATRPPARGRLTQALGDIPGPRAARALASLTEDDDPAVALTATYLLRLRGTE
ncbi:transcriptional regulator [Streptomyces olivaceus]|uniref:HEAT repeat domain-containing protein n=1 Tax=Streptomyces olivaceus TaxID=47716 RepID=UPI0022EEDFA6|nr:HEAT repeat domain-containing protein [Streptomyces olivaceus]GHJ01349.1 transcriptional regulator [Streptomyces olivaceus]